MSLVVHGNTNVVDALIAVNAVGIKRSTAIWFAQGILSPGAYIDNRMLKSHPKVWDAVLSDLRNLTQRLAAQYSNVVIASVATGGDHHASVLAWRLALPFVSVRKEEKTHGGKRGRIDGDQEILKGAKVILVEDMSSTFQSCLNAIRPLEEAGGHVVETILINTWNLPDFKRSTNQYRVHALCAGEMILDRMVALGKVDKGHEAIMRHWLVDPNDDSWADSSWQVPAKKD